MKRDKKQSKPCEKERMKEHMNVKRISRRKIEGRKWANERRKKLATEKRKLRTNKQRMNKWRKKREGRKRKKSTKWINEGQRRIGIS